MRDAIEPLKTCIAKDPGAALCYRALGIVFAKIDAGIGIAVAFVSRGLLTTLPQAESTAPMDTTLVDMALVAALACLSVSAWLARLQAAIVAAGIACAAAVVGQRMTPTALGAVAALGLLMALYARAPHGARRRLYAVAVATVSCALFMHAVPGFHNLCWLDRISLTADAVPYSAYVNIDKTLAGSGILYLVRCDEQRWQWRRLSAILLPAAVTLGLILGLAFASHYVRFEPKFPAMVLPWAALNLLGAVAAEEALFRGLLQQSLTAIWPRGWGAAVAVTVPALAFGALHWPGGLPYVVLASLAGMGYGWAAWRSQSVTGAIALHFLLNSVHFCLFTYPALRPG